MPACVFSAEESFRVRVESASDSHGLLEFLREDHPTYAGCSAAGIVRRRGWVLVTIARRGVPATAIPFLLEELESGHDVYLVAAAARAIRSTLPDPAYTPFVLGAIRNTANRDESVSFETFGEISTGAVTTSVIGELLETLEWLGPCAANGLPQIETLLEPDFTLEAAHRDYLQSISDVLRSASPPACCEWLRGPETVSIQTDRSLLHIQFEDQDGTAMTFAELFHGQPTIVAFFYTRCDNPLKCNLVISKLAQLQKRLAASGQRESVRVVAITYDPDYDLPKRLRTYAVDRGFQFDERNRVVRATAGFEVLRQTFQLGVNYSEATVNRHLLELLILDPHGTVTARFKRFLWKEDEVIQTAIHTAQRQPPPPQWFGFPAWMGFLASVGIVLFPKCPVCWAAYFSFFGSLGLGTIPYSPWLQPLLVSLVMVNIGIVGRRAWSAGKVLPLLLTVSGTTLIGWQNTVVGHPLVAFLGITLTLCGSLWTVRGTRARRPTT